MTSVEPAGLTLPCSITVTSHSPEDTLHWTGQNAFTRGQGLKITALCFPRSNTLLTDLPELLQEHHISHLNAKRSASHWSLIW